MKTKHLITTAISGLTVLTGGMLTSCSEDSSQSTAAAAQVAEINKAESQATASPALLTSCSEDNAQSTAAAQVAEINKAESRATAYPALAYLPKNTTTYLTGNVTEFVNTINKLAGQDIVQLPEEAKALDAFAIGITDGSEVVLSEGLPIVVQILNEVIMGQQPDPEQCLKQYADTLRKLKPIYLVVTCKTEEEAKETATKLNVLADMAKNKAPFLKGSQQGDWSLISCTISEIPAELSDIDLSACGDLTFSIATRTQGKAVIAAIATNPAELQAPATAADSVLSTTQAAALDDAASGKGIAALTISPSLANALRDLYMESTRASIKMILADYEYGDRELIATNHTLIDSMFDFWSKLVPDTKLPYSINLWQDGDIHLTLQGDANGLEFSTAQLNTTIPQDAFVYAYGSGITNYNAPAMAHFDHAAQAIFTFIAATESDEAAMKCQEVYNGIKKLLPSLSQLRNGLGSGWAAIGDMSSVRYDDDGKTQAPSLCLRAAAQLSDRATFEGGMEATINNVKSVVEIINPGSSDGIDELLATVTKTTSGNYTIYSHERLVDESDGLNAGAVISDSAVGIGSDNPQTIKLCDSLSGNTSVSGIVVNVNLAPIVQMKQKMYQSMLEITKLGLDIKKKRYETLNNSDDDMYNDEDEIRYLESELEESRQMLKRVSGGNMTITSQNGCLKTHIKLNTPALK